MERSLVFEGTSIVISVRISVRLLDVKVIGSSRVGVARYLNS